MVYNEEINRIWGELVFPKQVIVRDISIQSIRTSRNFNKATHSKIVTSGGFKMSFADFVPSKVIGINDENITQRSDSQTVTLNGFLLPTIKKRKSK